MAGHGVEDFNAPGLRRCVCVYRKGRNSADLRVAAALLGVGAQPPSPRSGSSIDFSIRHPHGQAVQKIVDAITEHRVNDDSDDMCCFCHASLLTTCSSSLSAGEPMM